MTKPYTTNEDVLHQVYKMKIELSRELHEWRLEQLWNAQNPEELLGNDHIVYLSNFYG